jgi:glutathione S-transferase
MILIGMFDSPYVRRVAVTLQHYAMPFEHRDWSVGRDFEQIRRFNPLGRVPTLVLDDEAVLVESAAILDFLDELAGPEHALLPAAGPVRRAALQTMALATGAADKGVLQIYETAFRPAQRRHPPWTERCRIQMRAALEVLDGQVAERGHAWLVADRVTQADVTVGCVLGFLAGALGVNRDGTEYPALARFASRCEALPAFRAVPFPGFGAPAPDSAPASD